MRFKLHVRVIFLIGLVVFILNKMVIRPWVLEHDYNSIIKIITLSIPNTIEAILGTLLVTGILIQLKIFITGKHPPLRDTALYVFAVGISAIYVITQELKWHNLGGRNVYDFYDLIGSIVGLMFVGVLLLKYGIIENKMK